MYVNTGRTWMRKFYKNYFKDNLSKEEIDECFAYKREHTPKSLFKYTNINHIEDLICNDLIYLSKIEELNDPYEGDVLYDLEHIYELYSNNYLNLIYNEFHEEGDDEKYAKNYLQILSKTELKDLFDNAIHEFKNDTHIICLSETNNINSMWGHYSENHKGVCIEYDFEKESNFKTLIFPVIYVKKTNHNHILEQIFTTGLVKHRIMSETYLKKSYDWNYEKE